MHWNNQLWCIADNGRSLFVCNKSNAAVTPSCESQSHKSHARQFSGMWLSCDCNRVYVKVPRFRYMEKNLGRKGKTEFHENMQFLMLQISKYRKYSGNCSKKHKNKAKTNITKICMRRNLDQTGLQCLRVLQLPYVFHTVQRLHCVLFTVWVESMKLNNCIVIKKKRFCVLYMSLKITEFWSLEHGFWHFRKQKTGDLNLRPALWEKIALRGSLYTTDLGDGVTVA